MQVARLAAGWSVRSSVPAPDLALSALVFYPDEFRILDGTDSATFDPGQPGLRIARRGVFVVAEADAQRWDHLAASLPPDADIALREPSGRNHEIKLGWTRTPRDQVERYGTDGLAGLTAATTHDRLVAWRAADLHTLEDLSWVLGN